MKKWIAAASVGLLAACSQPGSGYKGTTVTSAPAANPTGSEGAQSGQRSNMGAPADVVSAPAANPTGSEGAQSGQPSNMGRRSGFVSAPASGPVSNESPYAGQPSMMMKPRQSY